MILAAPKKVAETQYGVGLVFRTARDGKMVVSSFVKDSSAYECGLVRDGGLLPLVPVHVAASVCMVTSVIHS